MDGSGSGLTEFLLDLTEDETLHETFDADPDSVITSRGLDQYRDLLKSGDVERLRQAVRAEITGQAAGGSVTGVMEPPDGGEPEAIIAGVRIPGVRTADEPIAGVMEPGPPDEGIRGVMEPGPPEPA